MLQHSEESMTTYKTPHGMPARISATSKILMFDAVKKMPI